MKPRRKPKPVFPIDTSGLLKNMARIVDRKRERKEEKKRKREARRLKHGTTKESEKETKED